MMIKRLIGIVAALFCATAAHAGEPVHVYGAGGPAPAMKAAAEAFQSKHGVRVEVVAGPTPAWLGAAKADADLLYSGAENMMTGFIGQFGDAIDPGSVRPLYLRPSSILVRSGNPSHIHGLADLLRPGHRILVVEGAGQTGLWEDMAGRSGRIGDVAALRRNIVVFAHNSAEARADWVNDPSLDAWIIWNIWQVSNPTLAENIPVEREYRIYRDAGVALTRKGQANPDARAFVDFLASPEGAKIFARWGWVTPAGEAR
jgi:accessory colonization factor AcfC